MYVILADAAVDDFVRTVPTRLPSSLSPRQVPASERHSTSPYSMLVSGVLLEVVDGIEDARIVQGSSSAVKLVE